MDNHSFIHRGKTYVHHSSLPMWETAFHRVSLLQFFFFCLLLTIIIFSFLFTWRVSLIVCMACITCCYFIDLFFDFFIIYRSFLTKREIVVSSEEITALSDAYCPRYTILCPLYKEVKVLPQFLQAITSLSYPKEKLQVLLLLEEDDRETLAYTQANTLPSFVTPLIVPDSLPKTKPKACNFALSFVTGEYVVIYDAEDIPDKFQLKKAVVAFGKSAKSVICMQAKLNYYNANQNLLTCLFTAEYSLWFDIFLPGLQSIHAPIPLGGTSNHFKTEKLQELHGWDSFNVAEDADLGMRIAKYGYQTAVVDSTTMEEANSKIGNWLRQRSRWMKGYMQTYLVFMRKPIAKKRKFMTTFFAQIILGGQFFSSLINPFMWGITIIYICFYHQTHNFIHMLFPSTIFYLGIISFLLGNFLYTYYYLIGLIKRKQWTLALFTPFVPLYWLLMSLATLQALFEMFYQPHYWHKTAHGFHLPKKDKIPNKNSFVSLSV